MAPGKTPLLIVALVSLLWRCNSSIVLSKWPLDTSSARLPRPVALLSQGAETADPSDADMDYQSLPQVKHQKEAGGGYLKGSPMYRKQKYLESLHADEDKSTKASASAEAVVEMTYVVLVYVLIVGGFFCYFSFVILRNRNLSKDGRLLACRKTDRQVERMDELRAKRNESRISSSPSGAHDALEKVDASNSDVKMDDDPVIDAQVVDSAGISSFKGLSPIGSGQSTPRTAEWDEFAEAVSRGEFFSIESDMLVDVMGLSGMSLLEMDATSGISGLPLLVALPACALQAWFLQLVILFYMARRVARLTGEGGLDGVDEAPKDVPFAIIFAAVYLHFINCMNDQPFTFSILRHLGDLHEKRSHLAVAMPTFMMDGLIIPFTSLFVGALYLCTSATVSDVILNSCAVAFISNIDNWILQLNEKLNKAAEFEKGLGDVDDDDPDAESFKTASGMRVFIPVNHALVKNMSWWMCVVPIVPAVFSSAIGYIGLTVLHL